MNQVLSSNTVVLSEISTPSDDLIAETVRLASYTSPAVTITENRSSISVPADPAEQDAGESQSLANLGEALSKAYAQFDIRSEFQEPETVDFTVLQSASFRVGKRLFDILFAATALLALAPILLLCAACIGMTGGGSALFRQRRLGRNGKEFSIVKFRTMLPNAEELLRKVLERDPAAKQEWESNQKLRNDPRVVPLGRFLRRTSMDELPQFWNVLIGDMSVVGPRPIVRSEVRFYLNSLKIYSAVRPGVTGLWQVSGRNNTGYSRRVTLDCQYVRSWSAWLDLRILLWTIKAVVVSAGAY
ncbi:MAG: sugar transferase [Acidobacteriota bacterium]|nr:sugar transferase [Acidobacteriota bacterium]